MSNLNPQAEDQYVYVGTSQVDATEIRVIASSDTLARSLILDKIGYAVVDTYKGTYCLADADDVTMIETTLTSTNPEDALNEALRMIKWTVSEPIQLLGGSLGSGYGLASE